MDFGKLLTKILTLIAFAGVTYITVWFLTKALWGGAFCTGLLAAGLGYFFVWRDWTKPKE